VFIKKLIWTGHLAYKVSSEICADFSLEILRESGHLEDSSFEELVILNSIFRK